MHRSWDALRFDDESSTSCKRVCLLEVTGCPQIQLPTCQSAARFFNNLLYFHQRVNKTFGTM